MLGIAGIIRPRSSVLVIMAVSIALTAQSAHAGLFGPDKELLTPAQVEARLQKEPASFTSGGSALQIRTRGAAVGGFLVGMLVGSALGSAGMGSANNAAQMQQNMQAATQISQQTSANLQQVATQVAAEAAGTQTAEAAQRGPLPLIAQKIEAALLEHQAQLVPAGTTAEAPGLVLSLVQNEWKLEFGGFSDEYQLKALHTLDLLDKAADKRHLQVVCRTEHSTKMPLDDWEKDEHAAIASAAEELADRCYQQFVAALFASPGAPAELSSPVTNAVGGESAESGEKGAEVAVPAAEEVLRNTP